MNVRYALLSAAVWLSAIGVFIAKPSFAQSNGFESQMDLVVKLRIHRAAQSTEETAAGMLVGKDRQSAYFITASHAVIQDRVAAASVDLQFHNSPTKFKAKVFERYDNTLDLAVVEVSVANLPDGLAEVVRKDPTLTVPIHVIGHPTAGDWVVASGTVIGLNSSTGDIHRFTVSRDNALAEGHSGGPVFDNQGAFLGMHVSSGPTYGLESKGGEIVEQLAAWHVPTNNLTTVKSTQPGEVVVDRQADRDAINAVIDAYVDSHNQRNSSALWKIWPNPPPETKKSIEDYFQNAQAIKMKITERRVATDGKKATVMGQSSQEFKPKIGGSLKSPESPITVELEKQSGTWVITLVR